MVSYAVNYVAIIVAAIANMVVGYLWYSQMLFGKAWMKMTGKKDMGKKDSMLMMMGAGYISSVVMAYVLAIFIQLNGATTPLAGAMAAFWPWLGFVATVTLGSVLWEGKSIQLWVLNAAHYLVGMAVMGAVLVALH